MMDDSQKEIQVKFDNLTRDSIKEIRTTGCRVLHLSSDEYDEDNLCVEGPSG